MTPVLERAKLPIGWPASARVRTQLAVHNGDSDEQQAPSKQWSGPLGADGEKSLQKPLVDRLIGSNSARPRLYGQGI